MQILLYGPQKALQGISHPRSCSQFVGIHRQKLKNSCKIDFRLRFEGPGVGARLHGYPSRGRANCGRLACFKRISMNYLQERSQYLIAASVYDEYPGGPSIRPICTRCCFTMTSMIQVCSNFHDARVFILNARRMNSNWHL